MGKPKLNLLVAALLLAACGPSFGQNPQFTTIRVQSVTRAGPPQFLERQVLFSFQSDRTVRLVGARFEHEHYRVFHPYFRNENGIFLLLLDIPDGVDRLAYRISVDGLWLPDPFNPESEQDQLGVSFSVFSLAGAPEKPLESPVLHPGGEVTFWYRSRPGRFVSVIGEFNHWDPYWEPMVEIRPGLYTATVQLAAGRHFYTFSVDGERVPDPRNVDNAEDREGFLVSTFELTPARAP
jgi:1,4-alpha-glucan branching enzyme